MRDVVFWAGVLVCLVGFGGGMAFRRKGFSGAQTASAICALVSSIAAVVAAIAVETVPYKMIMSFVSGGAVVAAVVVYRFRDVS